MLNSYKVVSVTDREGEVKYAIRAYKLFFPVGYVDLIATAHTWHKSQSSFKDCLSADIDTIERVLKKLDIPWYTIKPVDLKIVKTEKLIDE